MVKVNKEQIEAYFRIHTTSSYEELSKAFGTSESLLRKKFGNDIVSSLGNKKKSIIYVPHHTFDANNLKKIKGILFSQSGNIKKTLLSLIGANDCISSNRLYAIFGFNVRTLVAQLVKEKKIFSRNDGKHSIYSLNPLNDEIIRVEDFDFTSLKSEDKVLKKLQIIKEAKENKKTDVAKKYNISTETVRNIEERFNRKGVGGLIHRRSSEPVKISSMKEAAIITEIVRCPEKTAKEIKADLNQLNSTSIKTITEIINRVKSLAKSKKKFLLEIE